MRVKCDTPCWSTGGHESIIKKSDLVLLACDKPQQSVPGILHVEINHPSMGMVNCLLCDLAVVKSNSNNRGNKNERSEKAV